MSAREVKEDLRVHAAIKQSQAAFYELISKGAKPAEPYVVRNLRQLPVYQIAEFFYLWRAFGIDGREQIETYVELHNKQVQELLADKQRMALFAFTPIRLQKAIYSPSMTAKLVTHYVNFDRRFDQSDLARLLVEVMSQETTRKAVASLAAAGYLELSEGLYSAVLVRSSGRLEEVFSAHLSEFRRVLREQT